MEALFGALWPFGKGPKLWDRGPDTAEELLWSLIWGVQNDPGDAQSKNERFETLEQEENELFSLRSRIWFFWFGSLGTPKP